MKKANFGSGPDVREGWVNIDRDRLPGVDIRCDVLGGLPCAAGEFDLIVTHHALQMMTAHEVVLALRELRRVTRPGGWIRVSVPDISLAFGDYERGLGGFGLFSDRRTPGARLNAYLTHYAQRSFWTSDHMVGVLADAGWHDICEPAHGRTYSPFPEAVELDNRPAESLYVEAVAP